MNPSRHVKSMLASGPEAQDAVHGQYTALLAQSPSQFFSPVQFQASLSPRFSNLNYGSQIRYNTPSCDKLAVPKNPLGDTPCPQLTATARFGARDQTCAAQSARVQGVGARDSVVENYCTSCGTCSGCGVDCRKGGLGGQNETPAYSLAPDYHAGNYKDVKKEVQAKRSQMAQASGQGEGLVAVSDMLPIGTMDTLTSEGAVTQPIVYDRFMYANRNSRLYGAADFIRGDVPVGVNYRGGWFDVYPNPSVDLNSGALNVIGGWNNEQGQSIAQLVNKASGGSTTCAGGVDVSNQLSTSLSAANSDVNVVAFA